MLVDVLLLGNGELGTKGSVLVVLKFSVQKNHPDSSRLKANSWTLDFSGAASLDWDLEKQALYLLYPSMT